MERNLEVGANSPWVCPPPSGSDSQVSPHLTFNNSLEVLAKFVLPACMTFYVSSSCDPSEVSKPGLTGLQGS